MKLVARQLAAFAGCVAMSLSIGIVAGSEAQASSGPAAVRSSNTVSYGRVASAFSMTITPTQLVLDSSDVGTVQRVLVINQGQEPFSVTVGKENFVGKANGSLAFQASAPYSASDWLTVTPTQLTVAPGTSRIVTTRVRIPGHPEPGDHQVALVFLVPAGKTKGNIKINRGIAAPVLITIPGKTSNTSTVSGLHSAGFAIGGPIKITATIHDSGNVHRDFRGKAPLKVTGAGSTVFPDFTVLRGSTRDVSTTWNPPLMCICHPTVSIVNADGRVQSLKIQVIVFPLVQLAIVLGSLVLLGLAGFLLRRRYRISVERAVRRHRLVSSGDA